VCWVGVYSACSVACHVCVVSYCVPGVGLVLRGVVLGLGLGIHWVGVKGYVVGVWCFVVSTLV